MDGPNEPVTNPFLRPGKLFGVDSSAARGSLLRPSVLTATAEKLRTDKPSALDTTNNPFASVASSKLAGGTSSSLASNPFFKVHGKLDDEEPEEKKEEAASSGGSTLAAAAAANMKEHAAVFAPSNGAQPALAPAPTGPVGFIFGKNISERVVKEPKDEVGGTEEGSQPQQPQQAQPLQQQQQTQSQVKSPPQSLKEFPPLPELQEVSGEHVCGNSSAEETDAEASFGAIAAARTDEEAAKKSASLAASKEGLSASAQEYQARQARPEFDQVEVLTGEENESNVLHLICRAFLFDRENNKWTERGRGFMRLNDAVDAQEESAGGVRLRSRLIFRLQGSLKVVLNTPVWSGMLVEAADEKRIRLTAQVPDEGVRIMLFQLNTANEGHHLLSALNSRILQLRQAEERDEAAAERPAGRKRRLSGASEESEAGGKERKERKQHTGDEDGEDEEKEDRQELPRPIEAEAPPPASDSP